MKVLLKNYEYKETILPCGFVTSETCPWLEYSLDGVIVNNPNEPIKLIEIKCTFISNLSVGLLDLVKPKYIIHNTDGSLIWNKKDTY